MVLQPFANSFQYGCDFRKRNIAVGFPNKDACVQDKSLADENGEICQVHHIADIHDVPDIFPAQEVFTRVFESAKASGLLQDQKIRIEIVCRNKSFVVFQNRIETTRGGKACCSRPRLDDARKVHTPFIACIPHNRCIALMLRNRFIVHIVPFAHIRRIQYIALTAHSHAFCKTTSSSFCINSSLSSTIAKHYSVSLLQN